MRLLLKQIPLGVAYAIWSGLGTAGAVVAGILLIIVGVMLLNLFPGVSAR